MPIKDRSGSVNFRQNRYQSKVNTSDKGVYFIMIKRLIPQSDITAFNVYIPNNYTSKHMKQP